MGTKKRRGGAQEEDIITTEIPQDIFTNILCRLPVKSLLRFKCVCKSWYTLLNDRAFIKLHLNESMQSKDGFNFMFRNVKFFSVDYLLSSASFSKAVEVDFPFKSPSETVAIALGSCHGIFLIGIYNPCQGPWVFYPKNQKKGPLTCSFVFMALCLWNPSTKEYKKLPDTLTKFSRDRSRSYTSVYGFGYNSKIDDYKVMRIFYYYDVDGGVGGCKNCYCESEVLLYSLQTDTCKRIQGDVPYYIHSPIQRKDVVRGTFVNGAIHWLGYHVIPDQFSTQIVSFDIANEEYKKIPQPDFDNTSSLVSIDLGVLQGGLCLYRKYRCKNKSYLDILMMKEYGLKESWEKLLTISPFMEPDWAFNPLCITNKGELIMQKRFTELLRYDPKHGCVIDIKREIYDFPGQTFEVESYIASLVPLQSNMYVGQYNNYGCRTW
ncbi:hypothetical protein IFM89_003134 [Coptis chinensis]|uniref:F-box domain-containing protein n=1 Tax=Coptis chinensis TaxID=261450 RepID=A0A835I8R1_9MAGN|nr:hypothetical protein IFM89_003134 [Coptis chinensis]